MVELTRTMILDILVRYGLADPLMAWSNTYIYAAILIEWSNIKNEVCNTIIQ